MYDNIRVHFGDKKEEKVIVLSKEEKEKQVCVGGRISDMTGCESANPWISFFLLLLSGENVST